MKVKDVFPFPAVYYLSILAVILFSFFSCSYAYYPFFNSDAALSVLMSYDYHFPADLYCWGQDRGGTLEMMIAHFFISLFHSSPLITASIVHYLLLTAGLLAAFHFIRKPLFRVALTIAWFFPSRYFIDTILYQFSIQFGLFIIALVFFDKAMHALKRKSLLLSLSFLFMLLNIWVLDLGLIPVFFFGLFVMGTIYQERRAKKIPSGLESLLNRKNIFLLLVWVAAAVCFIVYAKRNSSYSNKLPEIAFNDIPGIINVFSAIGSTISASLFFQGKIMESVYLYVFIFFIIVFTIQKSQAENVQQFYTRFFFWQAVVGIFLIILVKQVQLSEVPARYFAGSYLSFTLFVMMSLDARRMRNTILITSLYVLLAASVFSTLYENFFPRRLGPMVKNFPSLNEHKPVGIIGSYWNSYVFAAIDPENIKATPHDHGNVRNWNVAMEALNQPRLLLIKDEWFREYPDSIVQFGSTLIKKGEPFLLGTYISWEEVNDVTACQYLKMK